MSDSQQQGRILWLGFLLIIGIIFWYGWQFWHERAEIDSVADQGKSDSTIPLTDLRFLTAKEILARLKRNESIQFVDVRPREAFDTEHIVDALSVPVNLLSSFNPPPGKLLIVVSGAEVSNETLKGIHQLFKSRDYTFAFLEGTITDWKFAGGTTISTGDPDSSLDYTKVIFITPAEVMRIVDTLADPFFIDVRSAADFQKSHIPQSINLPLAEFERRRSEIPQGKSIFVYGTNDYESYQGGVRLFDLGFLGSRAIRGGFTAWQEQKLPVTSQ